jgi:hypothetical protein
LHQEAASKPSTGSDAASPAPASQHDSATSGTEMPLWAGYHQDRDSAADSCGLAAGACLLGSDAVDAAKVRRAGSWGAAAVDAAGAAGQEADFAANVPWWVIGRARWAGRVGAAVGPGAGAAAAGSAVVEDR